MNDNRKNIVVWKIRLLVFVFTLFSFNFLSYSQVDFEFWFAAPYGNMDHAPQYPEGYQYKVGGRPLYLRLATQDADADVVVTLPALGLSLIHI